MLLKYALNSLIVFIIFVCHVQAQVIVDDDPDLNKIDIVEHPGGMIPYDIEFTNAEKQKVTMGDYLNRGKPILLTLAYYRCPMLCGFVLNGLVQGARRLPYQPGDEYQILTVSIDPTETAELAAAKKANHVAALNKPGAEKGWDFLVGAEENSKRLADALGFKYYYIEERDEYAHAAVSFVITEEGIISRYLYGIEYKERDLRLALLEASEGKIGNTLDKIILYCFHYDPDAKGYVIFAGNVMKIGGVITLILLAGVLLFFWRKELYIKNLR